MDKDLKDKLEALTPAFDATKLDIPTQRMAATPEAEYERAKKIEEAATSIEKELASTPLLHQKHVTPTLCEKHGITQDEYFNYLNTRTAISESRDAAKKMLFIDTPLRMEPWPYRSDAEMDALLKPVDVVKKD